jgi:LysM repeat protein
MSAMLALPWPEDDAVGPEVPIWTVPAQAACPVAAPARARRSPAARDTAAHGQAARGPVARGPVARPKAPRGGTATVPLRLTNRGRIVVATAAALLVTLLSLLATGAAQATSHSVPPRVAERNLTQVVVQSGQSLWSVAETADPNADPRVVMQQIIELNGLSSDVIMAGEQLWVPRG